jgi:putative flippase GtrA
MRDSNRLNYKIKSNQKELISYAFVGISILIFDLILFNFLSYSTLKIEPVTSKIVAGILSTSLAFYVHRQITFGEREYERETKHQATLFFVVQAAGICIASACLWFSHYVLEFKGVVSDNIAGNFVGLGFATIFRFYFNSKFVYR